MITLQIRLSPSNIRRMTTDSSQQLHGLPMQRTPVAFDAESSGLRIGPYEQRIDDPTQPEQVYSAYLSLLYAVRGAAPGEKLALRDADLEALLLIVGDDPETIEKRLIGLMGCTAEEAKILGGLLLRHRRVTATLGVAAALSLGTVGVVSGFGSGDEPTRTQLVQPAAAGSSTHALEGFSDSAVGEAVTSRAAAPASASIGSAPSTNAVTLAGLDRPSAPAAPVTQGDRSTPAAAPADASPGSSTGAPAATPATPAGPAGAATPAGPAAPAAGSPAGSAPRTGTPAVDAPAKGSPVDVPVSVPVQITPVEIAPEAPASGGRTPIVEAPAGATGGAGGDTADGNAKDKADKDANDRADKDAEGTRGAHDNRDGVLQDNSGGATHGGIGRGNDTGHRNNN